jgi:uncharacterized SAM-binding protein YcdF (DUF218 family)
MFWQLLGFLCAGAIGILALIVIGGVVLMWLSEQDDTDD